MINARGETLAEKSAYRKAFERHRCLIPADGFYEWQALAGGRKQPMRVTRSDGAPFAFAGLSERWLSAAGDVVDSCTIVTTAANALLRPLGERMPVIVPPGEYARWLDNNGEPPRDLVTAIADDALRVHPVSTRVNAVRNDDASLIEPVDVTYDAAAEPAGDDLAEAGAEPLQKDLF